MANHKILAPFILSHEGGFSNNPKDPGGATMRGVTLATSRSVYGSKKTVADLKRITSAEWDARTIGTGARPTSSPTKAWPTCSLTSPGIAVL